MSGTLNHKPSEIVAAFLRASSLGTLPSANQAWPIFNDSHAPTPDNLLCCYDTSGVVHGQNQINGRAEEHYGIQLKSRADSNRGSYSKLLACALACDALHRVSVTISGTTYLVQSMARKSGILSLGTQTGDDALYVHTVNYLVSITQV